ncbi:MAG: LacI family transcriptional regulator [Thermobacillus sp.]|uniref:LacI family DNA-binding transcriptional regulator n=1 Tax=Thermobacillus sp. TaxID=2108467 RepID=UPI000E3A8C67|nr:LacI family DNA-binding transcriptional regulator [Thermobacillus sp.]REJ16156.1 MAG: LacI family transcriptional regulator [Paenibacillaceae bacterium]REK58402.1 MAG: LacI family transcriptional regulator [Thermobacillus sp.]
MILKRRTTIKDVARHAGVSTAAVSYVLNGKENRVSPETVEKIREAIRELNYIPDFSARSLVKNASKLVGVIIPQTEDSKQLILENPFYSEMVSNIESKLREHGYHLILSGVDKGKSYLDISVQRNLDGAIIMGIYPEQFYAELKEVKIPIVLIDSYINDTYFSKVGIDDEQGGYLATRYLIDRGHRNIALVTGSIRKDGVVEKRFLGYKRALQEAGVFYNPDCVFEHSVSYTYGYEAGKAIAAGHPEITAVFATADMVAFGVIQGIKESGKDVPQDISVIGFDDIFLSHMFVPPLTTVRQDIALKGRKAAELLLEIIESDEPDGVDRKMEEIPLSIVERQTVRSL